MIKGWVDRPYEWVDNSWVEMGGGDVASVGVGGGGRVYKVDYDSFKVF